MAGEKNAKGPKLGKYELLDTMTDDAKQEKCKANVEDTLTKYPDVACLIGLWAYNPPPMLAAVKEANKAGKVAIVGFSGLYLRFARSEGSTSSTDAVRLRSRARR